MVSYLSETRCLIYPRAVNEQRMEEHCVSLLHDKVNPGTLLIVIKYPMKQFVCFTLGKIKLKKKPKKLSSNHSVKDGTSADSQWKEK